MMYLSKIVLLLLISGLYILSAGCEHAVDENLQKKSFDSSNDRYTDIPKAVKEYLMSNLSVDAIYSSCSGRIVSREYDDYAFGVRDKNQRYFYVVVTKKLTHHDLSEKYSNKVEDAEEVMEVNCFAKNGVLEMNSIISSSEGTHGNVQYAGPGETLCYVPVGSPGGFSCKSYDAITNKFVDAGGWAN